MNRYARISFVTFLLLASGTVLPAGAASTTTPPGWSALRAAYDYPHDSPPVAREVSRPDDEFLLTHIAFTDSQGNKVPGLFMRPKARGVYPCALLLHGWTSDKETMSKYFGRPLAKRGVASLALDAEYHGERKDATHPTRTLEIGIFGKVIHDTIFDYREALDYLRTRRDVDSNRIGLLGYSMGSFMGSILAGVDDRIRDTVLCVGGDPILLHLTELPEAVRAEAEFVSPSNYIGHISPRPVYMINGTKDLTVQVDAAKYLQNAARRPKTIVWVDSGHILPESADRRGIVWLADRLTQIRGK